MEKQVKLSQSIGSVALVTGILLLIPFVAMQFTSEVNWSASDFVIMGALLFTTGTVFVFIIRYASNFIYKAAVTCAVGTTFLMIWSNLAVGLIGSGPHAGNLMFIGVVAVVIVGIFLSRLTAKGMELAMFAAALSVLLVAVISLLIGLHHNPDSSVIEILGVCGFFAMLYTISGFLFRQVSSTPTEKSAA